MMNHMEDDNFETSTRNTPARGEGWFATFTVLDFSGALHASQLRRVGEALAMAWKLFLRGVSDRSKSRALGV
jgi:hypothetical protein